MTRREAKGLGLKRYIGAICSKHPELGASVALMRFRSIMTLCLFGTAAIVALKYPLVGLAI
jgi:hypothetical protein